MLAAVNPVEVETGAWAVIAIGAVFSFIVLWLSHVAWWSLISPILQRVGNVGFGGVAGIASVHPLRFLHTFDTEVKGWINGGMAASERAITYGIGHMLWLFIDLSFSIVQLAENTWLWASRVEHRLAHSVPQVIRQTIVKPIEHTITRVTTVTAAQWRTLNGQVHKLEAEVAHVSHLVGARAHAAVGSIATTLPRIGHLEHDLTKVGHRVTDLERKFGKVALAGAVLAALARVGYGWVKCPNVGRFGRFLCGMDKVLMDALIAALTLVIATEGIVPFAKQVQGVVADFAPMIGKFWHADVIGQGGDRNLGDSTLH